MAVTERLMVPGRWDLKLLPDMPRDIVSLLDPRTAAFGHIVLLPTHVIDPNITSADLLAMARYTGIYRRREGFDRLSGPGPIAWISDEDNKGHVIETPLTFTAATFTTVMTNLASFSLPTGSVEALGGSYTNTFTDISIRQALAIALDYFDAEFRVNPNLTRDAGSIPFLYPTTTNPTAFVWKKSSGRDILIQGIHATKLDTALDYDDYTTKTSLVPYTLGGSATITSPFRDALGNVILVERLIDGSNIDSGNATVAATAQLNRFKNPRTELTLATDLYDIGGDIRVGDTVWVYDEELGLYDTTNQVNYRGQLLFPTKIRVLGMTWKIREGMGVYFRKQTGASTYTITDLTNFVDWETGDAEVEVGAAPRSIGS